MPPFALGKALRNEIHRSFSMEHKSNRTEIAFLKRKVYQGTAVVNRGPRFILEKRGAKYSSNLVTLPTVQPSCLFILGVSWLSFIVAALSFLLLFFHSSIPSSIPRSLFLTNPIRPALSHTNSYPPAPYLFWINASALSTYEFLYSFRTNSTLWILMLFQYRFRQGILRIHSLLFNNW